MQVTVCRITTKTICAVPAPRRLRAAFFAYFLLLEHQFLVKDLHGGDSEERKGLNKRHFHERLELRKKNSTFCKE